MRTRLAKRMAGYAGPACPHCGRHRLPDSLKSGVHDCPSCGHSFEVVRFEPVEPRAAVVDLAAVGAGETAPCATHARNRAEATCSRCGQFMCALCRIDAEGKVFCPPCFERLSAEGTLASTVKRTWNWGGMGCACALASYLLFWTIVIPAAGWIVGIYFCARGLREKRRRVETDGVFGLYVTMGLNLLGGALGIFTLLAVFGVFR
jgi:uncharacterized Zn finger protein (UPF0148 family)